LENTKLTPIRLPVDLLADLDSLVGKRQKSKFIIEATKKELLRLKQKKTLQAAAGILKTEDYPEFTTAADVSAWVQRLREETEARRREIFGD
jgi:metal-responsive CopG/Arc/MetJ family transcriptional regulator